MKVNAACSMNALPDAGVHPTRRIGANASMSFSCAAKGLSPEELGGEKITIRLQGLKPEQIARVLQLVTAIKEPGADSKAIVDEIKKMQDG